MKGLVIQSPNVEAILEGRKPWEMRSSKTKSRGRIALIRSGSGLIVGICGLIDVLGPLTLEQLEENRDKHLASPHALLNPVRGKPRNIAWVLANARNLSEPIAYDHPRGAVIWVNLDLHPQRDFLEAF